jgi:ABC-type multidrug transport system ATPase subunit
MHLHHKGHNTEPEHHFPAGLLTRVFGATGLDSHAAFVVMDHLRLVAKQGCTIICALHQPRQKIWDMLNRIHLLAEGFTIYSGDPKEVNPGANNIYALPHTDMPLGFPQQCL